MEEATAVIGSLFAFRQCYWHNMASVIGTPARQYSSIAFQPQFSDVASVIVLPSHYYAEDIATLFHCAIQYYDRVGDSLRTQHV